MAIFCSLRLDGPNHLLYWRQISMKAKTGICLLCMYLKIENFLKGSAPFSTRHLLKVLNKNFCLFIQKSSIKEVNDWNLRVLVTDQAALLCSFWTWEFSKLFKDEVTFLFLIVLLLYQIVFNFLTKQIFKTKIKINGKALHKTM